MMPQPLTIDVDAALEPAVGAAGVTPTELDDLVDRGRQVHDHLLLARARGHVGFADLYMLGREAMRARDAAESLASRFEQVIVLTEGAEADVVATVLAALAQPFHNLLPRSGRAGRPRVLLVDSADPDEFCALLESFPVEQTLTLVVSKTGSDLGHLVQFGVVRDMLRMRVGPGYQDHLIVVTDPTGGALREEALREGLMAFEIPRNVPARYAVLTPAALLPAALAGIDVRGILAGAHAAAEMTAGEDLRTNPAYLFASMLHLLASAHGRRHVSFVSAHAGLAPMAQQMARLMESALRGSRAPAQPDGAPTYGTFSVPRDAGELTDRCSRGRGEDAVVLLDVVKASRDRVFPAGAPGLDWLAGKQLSEVADARHAALRSTLREAGVPLIRVTLPSLTPNTLGALHMVCMLAASFGAGLAGETLDATAPLTESARAHVAAVERELGKG